MFDPERARGLDARIGLRLGEESFLVRIAEGKIRAVRGAAAGMEVVLTGPAPIIAAAVYGGQRLQDLAVAGALRVEGDWALAERFVTLFPLPAKVAGQPSA
jgi:ubiquinone biosynthesis protein UbiJ